MHERSIAASYDCIWSAAVHIMSHACNLIAASSSHMQAPMQAYHACVEHMFNWELYVLATFYCFAGSSHVNITFLAKNLVFRLILKKYYLKQAEGQARRVEKKTQPHD